MEYSIHPGRRLVKAIEFRGEPAGRSYLALDFHLEMFIRLLLDFH